MKPIHARAVDHLKIIFKTFARRDGISWMPVHLLWNKQSMPMDNGRVGKFVLKSNLDALTFLYPKNGTEIGVAQRLD